MHKKLTPEDAIFWDILALYHTNTMLYEYIKEEFDYCDFYGVPVKASYLTDTLIQLFPQLFPGTKRWFNGIELLSVWQYEKEHPEINDLVLDYIKKKELSGEMADSHKS